MDFSLNPRQRAWQDRARKFAEEEIRPISLARDRIADPFEAFDWDIIKKGSRLGFRTAVVAKEAGGHGIDFVTQALSARRDGDHRILNGSKLFIANGSIAKLFFVTARH